MLRVNLSRSCRRLELMLRVLLVLFRKLRLHKSQARCLNNPHLKLRAWRLQLLVSSPNNKLLKLLVLRLSLLAWLPRHLVSPHKLPDLLPKHRV